MEHIKYHHQLAAEDVEDYLGNPINAFTLIKRMVNDWKDVNELLKLHDSRNSKFCCKNSNTRTHGHVLFVYVICILI